MHFVGVIIFLKSLVSQKSYL